MSDSETSYLADWIAIRELTAKYNHSIDDGNVEGFGSVFTEDAVIVFQSAAGERVIEGQAEIAKMAVRPPGQRVHATPDAIIKVNGDTATQVCTLIVTPVAAPGTAPTVTGRYTDELVRTPDGWRFTRRTGVMLTPPTS
jgi:ketosteroid isomerase-like protein